MPADNSLPEDPASATGESVAPAGQAAPSQAQDAASLPEVQASAAAPALATLSPAACAQQLKQLFPALFGGSPKPLKLRIQADIQERAPGIFTKQVLSAFLRRYTGGTSYLMASAKASHRFDLDGAPAGELSDEHRQAAVQELARRRSIQDERRALEDEQRRNRAGLLRAFETTTLTPANFCALMGVVPDELEGLLVLARQEAEQRAQQAPTQQRPPRGAEPRRHGKARPR